MCVCYSLCRICGVSVCEHRCTCSQRSGEDTPGLFFYTFLYSLDTGSLPEPELAVQLDWLANEFLGPACLCPPMWGQKFVWPCSLYVSNMDPHLSSRACMTSTLTNWAISPAHICIFLSANSICSLNRDLLSTTCGITKAVRKLSFLSSVYGSD